MKTRTITLLTITLIVLACVYHFDTKRKLQRWTEQVEQGRLLPFPVEKLDRLEAAGPAGRFILERRADGWWITDPVVEKADQKVVAERILGVLEKASKFGAMSISESDRNQYGLGDKAVKVTATSGKDSLGLVLGGVSPIESEIYLSDLRQPLTVYVTQAAVRKACDRPLLDLRDKRVVDFDTAQAPSLSIQRGTTQVLFRKTKEGVWMTAKQAGGWRLEALGTETKEPQASSLKSQVSSEPAASSLQPQVSKWVRADRRAVERILQAVPAMMPLTDRESAGLKVPPLEQAWAVLRIAKAAQAGAQAQAQEAVIAFYPLPEDSATTGTAPRASWYAAIQGSNLPFKAPPALAALLSFSPESFQDRLVFSLEAAEVCYLQIEWKIGTLSSTVALSREPEGRWVLPAEPAISVNQETATKYVALCLGQEMASEKPSTDTLDAGLDAPMLRVSLANNDRSRREGFEIGNAVAKGSPVYFARRAGSPGEQEDNTEVRALHIVPSLEEFIKSRENFLDRSAIPFEASAVARVEMTVTSQEQKTTLTLTRRDDAAHTWQGTFGQSPPKSQPANLVEPLLAALRGLQYTTEVRDADEALIKRHGLNAPQLAVRLYGRDGREIASLRFGRPLAKEEVILVRRGSGECFYVAGDALFNLAQALGALVSRMQ